jgi:putative endonuclease
VLSTKQLQKNNFQIGYLGESFALEFLKSQGYTILGTNLSWKNIELDILACTTLKNPYERILICVEVKTRAHKKIQSTKNVIPTFLAYTKQKHLSLKSIASRVVKQYKWNGLIRFDLITVDLELENDSTSLSIKVKNKQIEHYQHVMY